MLMLHKASCLFVITFYPPLKLVHIVKIKVKQRERERGGEREWELNAYVRAALIYPSYSVLFASYIKGNRDICGKSRRLNKRWDLIWLNSFWYGKSKIVWNSCRMPTAHRQSNTINKRKLARMLYTPTQCKHREKKKSLLASSVMIFHSPLKMKKKKKMKNIE